MRPCNKPTSTNAGRGGHTRDVGAIWSGWSAQPPQSCLSCGSGAVARACTGSSAEVQQQVPGCRRRLPLWRSSSGGCGCSWERERARSLGQLHCSAPPLCGSVEHRSRREPGAVSTYLTEGKLRQKRCKAPFTLRCWLAGHRHHHHGATHQGHCGGVATHQGHCESVATHQGHCESAAPQTHDRFF